MESKHHILNFISYKHSVTIENVESELHILESKIKRILFSQFTYYYQHHMLPLAMSH